MVKSYALGRCHPAAVVAERDAMSRVLHPLCASLVRTAKDDDRVYVVMTAALGGPLHRHIRRAGKFEASRALFYAAQCADALAHCHEWGVIHRDVKASNVVLNDEGRVVLVDFGAAAVFDPGEFPGVDGRPRRETYCGTPHAMAPEMVGRRGHGCGVDWWALGVLLVEMATGKPPFAADDPSALFENIRRDDVEPDLSGVGDPAAAAVARALLDKRRPERRRVSAERVVVDDEERFSPALWKAALVSRPPAFSRDEGYLDWFEDTGDGPPAATGEGDEDPWADF